MPNYITIVDKEFEKDLRFIVDNYIVEPDDLSLFQSQLDIEQERLDEDWEALSRKTEYPLYSTYGYRKRYFHSLPESLKETRGWQDRKADFRIIFKVYPEKQEILYFGIGVRIKTIPKDPDDIWSRLQQRVPPQ